MDQFQKDLEVGGILKYMKISTDLMRPMFVNDKKALTAGMYIYQHCRFHNCINV